MTDIMSNELKQRFFGNAIFACGKLINKIPLEDFKKEFGFYEIADKKNDNGTVDLSLGSKNIYAHVEIKNDLAKDTEFVTHINCWEVMEK